MRPGQSAMPLCRGTPNFWSKGVSIRAMMSHAGGFTGGDAGAVLTVDFPPELLAQFDSGQRHGLLSALAADPRPRYQDDPDRVYGMAYAGKNVRFTVQDGTVRVVGVE